MKQQIFPYMQRGFKYPVPRSSLIALVQQVMGPREVTYWNLVLDSSDLFFTWRETLIRFIQQPNDLVQDLCEVMARSLEFDRRWIEWFNELSTHLKITSIPFDIQNAPPWLVSMLEISSWKPRSIAVSSDFATDYLWRERTCMHAFLTQALLRSITHLESKGFALDHPTIFSILGGINKLELEALLASRVQEEWEAAISMLLRPIPSKSESDVGQLCGLRAIWHFGAMIMPHFCLLQNPYLETKLPGCREWNHKFLQLYVDIFGYSKVEAFIMVEPNQFEPLRLQVWSLAWEDEDKVEL
jgi:hypothetical protein